MMVSLSDITAVVLCGGQGSRLKSVTGQTPKVMAEFGQEPFLNFILNYLQEQGIRNIVLCTGYKADILENYYEANNQGLNIRFSKEDKPLGTGGALKNAIKMIESDPCFVLNGDSLCEVDLKALLDSYYKKETIAELSVSKVDNAEDYGSIVLNEENRIMAFEEKQSAENRYVNAGVYCISKRAFDLMPEQDKFSLEVDYFPKLVSKDFYGFVVDNKFYDIGTPERFNEAQRKIRRR
ncbi:MAG: nucleotidyltransferase family protein [Candidatus Zapsychrus exili]|nr:nucleotidyltransferase family protein [Candidatus Zapsychrus exili]